MLRETLVAWGLLFTAALLEAGGDALIRMGLRGPRWALLAGPLVLAAYGFLVNVPQWDFSRLMGVYIAFFFIASQLLAVTVFREPLRPPVVVGGLLIIAGGLVLSLWRTPVGG